MRQSDLPIEWNNITVHGLNKYINQFNLRTSAPFAKSVFYYYLLFTSIPNLRGVAAQYLQ